MAMGKRRSEQAPMWIPTTDLPVSPGHPFYARLNAILDEAGFDRFAEEQCRQFYAPVMGRPSLPPGRYFRLLLLGYFEGLDSERGIAWRAADSLAVRSFVGLGLDATAPDHSTISRTRRLIDVETHRAVFTWVQERLVAAGLLKGRTIAIDATTLEANAAMRSIVRRDTGESYQEFLTRLAAVPTGARGGNRGHRVSPLGHRNAVRAHGLQHRDDPVLRARRTPPRAGPEPRRLPPLRGRPSEAAHLHPPGPGPRRLDRRGPEAAGPGGPSPASVRRGAARRDRAPRRRPRQDRGPQGDGAGPERDRRQVRRGHR